MKMSRRARRMQRQHGKNKPATLNMVSLMDIFTILLFFLLVSSTNQALTPSSKVKLPDSKATLVPEETLVVTVTDDSIVVQGRMVASVADVLQEPGAIIPALKEELEFHAGNVRLGEVQATEAREVTIVGDKQISYELLKKIMVTCTRVNYSNISLAVNRKAAGQG